MLTRGQRRRLDHGLIIPVQQIAERLEFKLIDADDYWALISNDKTTPSAIGDLYFIARWLEQLSKKNTRTRRA